MPASFDSFAAWKFCKRTTTLLLLLLLLLLLADAHHCIPSCVSHSKHHNTIRTDTTRMIHHTWDDNFLQAAPMLRNLSQQHHHNNKEPRHPKLSFNPFRQNLQIHCPPGTSQYMGVSNGWFIMENSVKMDDLGVSLFLETSIY